ncbi:MAG: N4-(beta-N-acetylglucosaminyl)-L-asparaginase [Saprospiraceae bacterium]|jgi:N4-(beta-N-acetylglucosaminyl)-L-asparaginase
MSNTIKRRRLLKLFPAYLAAPAIIVSTAKVAGCAPAPVSNIGKTVIISTWNNQKANNLAAEAAKGGKNIIDSIVEGISHVESDIEDMSVGKGGRPDREGDVTLDSCIMDHQGNAGGVCFMKDIEHPIQVARDVMYHTPHVLLAGEGATKFALERGHPKTNLLTEAAAKALEEWKVESKYQPIPNIEQHDTIGMIGIHGGKLGGGCSTSGLAYKMQGRVGDSPIIGAGLYVDGETGACTATGMGEIMMKNLSCFLVVEFMRSGDSPTEACKKAVKRVADKIKGSKNDQQMGLIALDRNGNIGGQSVLPGFVYAVTIDGETDVVKVGSYFNEIEE